MDFTFCTSQDGTRLRVGQVTPATPSGRDLLIVPGLAEHAGRYLHVAEAAAARGWTVRIVELRGHGHSGGRRGFVTRWSDYTADVQAAAALCSAPPSVLAHSMGGLVVMEALRDGALDAVKTPRVALSNPLLGVKVRAPRIKIAAAGLLSKIWPTLNLGNELDAKGISRDAAVVEAYLKDELVYHTLTPRWYTEMRDALERVRAASFTTPLHLFYSETDPITDGPAAKLLVERNGGSATHYPGMLHEILNEIGKEQVIADVLGWLGG